MNQKYLPTCGAVIVSCKDKYLLLQRGETAPWMPLKWNLPGGISDPDESPVRTAIRECEEEAGFTPDLLLFLTTVEVDCYDIYFYQSEENDFPEVKLCWESSQYKWLTKEEVLASDLVPGIREAFEYIK